MNKKNIVIMGHMGSGKSVIGKILAKQFNCEHVDSDKEIIKYANKSINEIFQEKGEEYFRNIETEILHHFLEKKNIIISLGGGSILNTSIRNKLIKNSISIFLDVEFNVLKKRLMKSVNRPLLKNTNIIKKVKELDTSRRKYYLRADIKIENTDTIFNTCQNLTKKLYNFYEKTNSNKNK